MIAAYYASPAFLRAQPGGGMTFAPRLSPSAIRAVAHSVYLQDLLGTLPPSRRRALAAVQHARFAEAIALLRPLAQRRPDDAKLQSDLAAALVLAGKPSDAAHTLAAARAATPADPIWRAPAADLDGAR